MKQALPIRLIVLMLVVVSFSLLAVYSSYETVSAAELPCLQCHKSKKAGKVVHSAVEMGCATCHNEPHRNEKPELDLTASVPDLCFQCHDAGMFQKKSVHSAVAAGMCTSCHNPHSSDLEKLLTDTPPGLCYGCHDKGIFTKRVQHGPVADGQCLLCHNPHASDYAYNLSSPVEELCTMCHPDKSSGKHVLAGLGFGDAHPVSGKPDPSREGKQLSCLSCHSPHSSVNKALLVHDGTTTKSLCLLCHKKSSLRFD
jgi:predicted CXXCH cytochrome family protein